MPLFQFLLRMSNFRNPLLRTLVPSISTAFAIQAAFAPLPPFVARQQCVLGSTGPPKPTGPIHLPWGSRGVELAPSRAFGCRWALRLGSYLFQRVLSDGQDSRFDEIKRSPAKFAVAFTAQATWVSLCLLPVITLNAVPAAAFASIPAVQATDVLGLLVYAGGFAYEIIADRQKSKWAAEKKAKVHDEEFLTRGLWSRSQFPNYFGEISLWTGIATAAFGVLAARPIRTGLGLPLGIAGPALAMGMSYISPAFVSFLLLKISGVPLSEKKYNERYGHRKDYQAWKENTPKLIPKLF
ncbi:hypothetical protein HYQ44_009155 [Verticillium longisporum]|nr:hypothetical protein HYQ44_009155 [Verticillium longisporum]